ncbi:hypothetical protein EJO69_10395 [Flaviflexus salsibiostraticola]|uniref:Uncharacterized protein n=1 Tax=Flaviflexus salsibiostraticola TaxID=1282737 RepID=A0A3S8ZB24_9ACTO|nr:hypothetical protein [Flaviflexus salsibiostraticola]AZN30665.1 hypothetical protein EJO69_10395 [Flaviflexus salsibiostraticola]
MDGDAGAAAGARVPLEGACRPERQVVVIDLKLDSGDRQRQVLGRLDDDLIPQVQRAEHRLQGVESVGARTAHSESQIDLRGGLSVDDMHDARIRRFRPHIRTIAAG